MEARASKSEAAHGHEVLMPDWQRLPLVAASPHSGCHYPQAFLEQSCLDPITLRRSEDSFVDLLFESGPQLGAPLLRALFPRAYVDPNREPFELDPTMFEDELPSYANTRSARVVAGLGTIARVVATGAPIYANKLAFAEALVRLRRCYWPYHAALRALIETTKSAFGFCILLDCHSMPSSGLGTPPSGRVAGTRGEGVADIVLGDCFGTACAPSVTATIERLLNGRGYRVVRNSPYSGGFVTRHYGRPNHEVHAVQIEINRALYMDETRIAQSPGFFRVRNDMAAVLAALGSVDLYPQIRPAAAE